MRGGKGWRSVPACHQFTRSQLNHYLLKESIFDGVSTVGRSWHLLWCPLWEEYPLGNRVSFWSNKRSSVCRQHFEFASLPLLGSFLVYFLMGIGICIYNTS
uniref:Putative ovule protein n=1 Tax=Solanum chacoense TaxID=4108 RepID=A0A0V0H5R1_SOLCH